MTLEKGLDPRLLGKWRTTKARVVDEPDEPITMEFLDDGSLTYIVEERETNQVALLTFRTEDGILISDQPSAPREERIPYSFADDGRLMLLHEGGLTTFARVE